MSRQQVVRIEAHAHRSAPRRLRRLLCGHVSAVLLLVAGACAPDRVTQPARWDCATTRPALDGAWVGTLDGGEIVLQIVERECIGALTFPYVGWPLEGTWTWKGIGGPVSGGGPKAGTLPSSYSASANLSYSVTLIRGLVGAVNLRLDSLPAGSTITAQLSGAWGTSPTPPPGPLLMRRR